MVDYNRIFSSLLSMGLLLGGLIVLVFYGPTRNALNFLLWFGYSVMIFPILLSLLKIDSKYLLLINIGVWLNVFGLIYAFNNLIYYDKFVHLSVGIIAGLAISDAFKKNAFIKNKAVFVFIFLSVLGVSAIWEVSEYFGDILFNDLAQGVYNNSGEVLVPPLDDTMQDLILNGIGAILAISFIRLKRWQKQS